MSGQQAGMPSPHTLMAVVEGMLADLGQGREPGKRVTKEDLLVYLKSGSRKLNLHFLRTLSKDEISLLRRDPAFQEKLYSALRGLIISLHQPLLNPARVKSLLREASAFPLNEVRRDPDLWAARLLAFLPAAIERPLPLVDLRYILALTKKSLESRVPAVKSLDELDNYYLYIERELGLTPLMDIFAKRAMELAENIREPGDIVAFYRLLSLRIPETLKELPLSPEKDRILLAIKALTGFQEAEALADEFKKRAMKKADELMKNAKNYTDLYELRFFFSQIGERSNRKLLSRKAGELARSVNVKTQGYDILTRFDREELEEDGLLNLVPAIMARAEIFVLNAPLRYLDLLMSFYLETVCPFLRRLKSEPEKAPRLIQNFKRQVGLLNIYRDLDHLAQVIQRKMVLAVCGPQMLAKAPEKILSYLTRLPPEFYPPKVMQALRTMIRAKGSGYRFTTGDVLLLLAAYPPPEEEVEEGVKRPERHEKQV